MHTARTANLWLFPGLRKRREDAKLTQNGLAQLARKHDPEGFGISKETISKLERGYGVSRRLAIILIDTLSEVYDEKINADVELTRKNSPRGRIKR